MDPVVEQRAIQQCQAGSRQEFAVLYDAYAKRVYDFLYYKTLHREAAEDLTSQTFIKALENISKYDAAKGKFSSWLYRIAQNTFIDSYRRRRGEVDIDQVFHLSSGEDVAKNAALKEQLQRIEQYLDGLVPAARDLVILRVWNGLTYQEIAELTGKSEAALKMAFSRTIRELRARVPLALALLPLLLNR